MKTRIALYGYGNLAKGVEKALLTNTDMELVAIFSRRAGVVSLSATPVFTIDKIADFTDKIDVMILCGGSATDLPEQTPEVAKLYNTVDSFDNHSKIPEYFDHVDSVAKLHKHVSAISIGWDPGVFSMMRAIFEATLPQGNTYTFWGKGVSQGHSDAIRRIAGVVDAKQYTIPKEEALTAVRAGSNPTLTTRMKHLRECFVVASPDADHEAITQAIVTMPAYFSDYDTIVHFVSQEELDLNHSGMPHGGFVLRSGSTSPQASDILEFSLKLDSNPEFTSSVLVSYARAVHKLAIEGSFGAKTVLDIPLSYMSAKPQNTLVKELL